jgi:hypothetical protein
MGITPVFEVTNGSKERTTTIYTVTGSSASEIRVHPAKNVETMIVAILFMALPQQSLPNYS